ncbi:hypothetical protein HL667_20115 [Bradyrhizobium sp. 83012]|uniref:Uncharacterized protein n=1 Tax=Bradyrhizobium aeschynomenes TaxID=2734909 RepID=A0ABX2CGJ7_9BRAD|nr:hypothetical protein [Bradyrhizobium aeschynomenes]NPU11247.1 hypothetical protein [Bradyrhizobium aeschynomenes]NPU67319.1 hypothetical protein [Bradyrhizobium aeschynomenes]NPV21910.1 hypothetical protein [Bradyrhizobium aeschynomenes]
MWRLSSFGRHALERLVTALRPTRAHLFAGTSGQGAFESMETIRPENTDPIPLRPQPQRIGTIMVRFVGLLMIAMAVMVLIWSR